VCSGSAIGARSGDSSYGNSDPAFVFGGYAEGEEVSVTYGGTCGNTQRHPYVKRTRSGAIYAALDFGAVCGGELPSRPGPENPTDAKDVLQETALVLFKKFGEYRLIPAVFRLGARNSAVSGARDITGTKAVHWLFLT